MDGTRAEDPQPAMEEGKGSAPLVLPTGDLVAELRAFCHRFQIDERLQTKVMDALKKRKDEEWRQDLAELNRALSTARNPSGMLCVKLGDLDKLANPNQLCFNYRAGTCTYGSRCKFSHDVATGTERMNSKALLAQGAKGTIASLPSTGGFSDPSVNANPRRVLRRHSSSSSRGRSNPRARSRSRGFRPARSRSRGREGGRRWE
ncbi:unnamed protein product [Effrenium voratum]|nr:unnamed protein product [Effrenium voratum]